MTDIRLAPSGPPISNNEGAPLSFGRGARLRLEEAISTMSGSQAIPTVPDVICPDGFGNADAIVLTLPNPRAFYRYRANLSLDIITDSTNVQGEVVLFLDVSVDGGATYTNRAKNVHFINSSDTDSEARQVQVWLPMSLGSALGVDDSVPTPSIKLRARAQCDEDASTVNVSSLSAGSTSTGLNGTIHMEIEECF